MAKKGGVQQLQAEIETDEAFEIFINRPGLIVLDVYTDWCGPCVGMVGALKKIKLEIGGENLHLAICKSDTIEALARFRNKSEPTWLFLSDRKAVNIYFGTNVPQLSKLLIAEIANEEKFRAGKLKDRKFFGVTDLQPPEVERIDAQKAKEEEIRLAKIQAAEEKRKAYLTYVTDSIMENAKDVGVTIFGPHITREMLKRCIEVAEEFKLSCKDRRKRQIQLSDLEVLHFGCDNPLSQEIWEQMSQEEVLCCYWKLHETETRENYEVMIDFVKELVKEDLDENGEPKPDGTPAAAPTQEVRIRIYPEVEPEPEPEPAADAEVREGSAQLEVEQEEEEMDEEEVVEEEGEEVVEEEIEPEPEVYDEKIIIIPGVWAPNNKRSIASAIYLIFRHQTMSYLPPDPVPDPPHLAVVFDAYKKRDINDTFEKYKSEVISYGFFTSGDPDDTELIASSFKEYLHKRPPVAKLVLKVAKKTSHAVLAFSAHGPNYVSPNTEVGEEDCFKFFPEGYECKED